MQGISLEKFSPLPAAIQFSFAPITRTTGNEATHSQSMLDIVVPVVLSISPSTAVLPADIIVTISVQPGGSATCRSTVAHKALFHLLYLHVYMYMPCFKPPNYVLILHLQWAKTLLYLGLK